MLRAAGSRKGRDFAVTTKIVRPPRAILQIFLSIAVVDVVHVRQAA